MKHLTVFFTFCLALMATSLLATAPPTTEGNLLVRSALIGERAMKLTMANLEQQHTRVILRSLDGKRTYLRHHIRDHNGFSMRIDLSSLEQGKYLLEIDQADETVSQVLVVENEQILLSKLTEHDRPAS